MAKRQSIIGSRKSALAKIKRISGLKGSDQMPGDDAPPSTVAEDLDANNDHHGNWNDATTAILQAIEADPRLDGQPSPGTGMGPDPTEPESPHAENDPGESAPEPAKKAKRKAAKKAAPVVEPDNTAAQAAEAADAKIEAVKLGEATPGKDMLEAGHRRLGDLLVPIVVITCTAEEVFEGRPVVKSETAQAHADEWLREYLAGNDAERRTLLGWDAKGTGKAGTAAPKATTAVAANDRRRVKQADRPQPFGQPLARTLRVLGLAGATPQVAGLVLCDAKVVAETTNAPQPAGDSLVALDWAKPATLANEVQRAGQDGYTVLAELDKRQQKVLDAALVRAIKLAEK